jgi:hypothetical protein
VLYHRVVRRKLDVSEEHIAYIFRVEEQAQRETWRRQQGKSENARLFEGTHRLHLQGGRERQARNLKQAARWVGESSTVQRNISPTSSRSKSKPSKKPEGDSKVSRRKLDCSKEHIAYIFRVEEQGKHETWSRQQAESVKAGRFDGTCRLHPQGRRVGQARTPQKQVGVFETTRCYNPQDRTVEWPVWEPQIPHSININIIFVYINMFAFEKVDIKFCNLWTTTDWSEILETSLNTQGISSVKFGYSSRNDGLNQWLPK